MYTNILESEGLPPCQHGYVPIGDHSQVGNPRLLIYCCPQQRIVDVPYTHDYLPLVHADEQEQVTLMIRSYPSFEALLRSLISEG